MQSVLFILGPTAAGKSALAIALAAQVPLELISMDSAQIYRGMDIGTAKPDLHTQHKIPHHLIDIIDPDQRYSAAQFRNDVLRSILEIHTRGKVAVVVGGTMMYYQALINGLHDLPIADEAMRKQIDARAQQIGWPAIHHELKVLDPITAKRLAPNDTQRIQRALEVCLMTGIPFSQWLIQQTKTDFPYPFSTIALFPQDRKKLHAHIALRFQKMLDAGLIEEVQALQKQFNLNLELPSMRSVGYRQVWKYLDGVYDQKTMVEKGIIATRQLAKRQMTWLRSFENLTVFDPFEHSVEYQLEKVQQIISKD